MTVAHELSLGSEVAIIALVDALFSEAHNSRASDIHIDPSNEDTRIRFRVDGVLQEVYFLPKSIHGEVVSRIKVLAHLRTDEHQATQDGRFRFSSGTDSVDMRVSIMPTYHGENIVIRILSDTAVQHTFSSLGFSEADQKKIFEAVQKQNGMILATGPTGSGKTTTLYTLVKLLNQEGISILTIEDPIEYAIQNITQIQVNPKAGLSFANGLRSILRQDPNIIMVGEIRDAETAGIAVNTALTGHLLLSTLHTNDASTTLPRLLDMGIDSYLIASTVHIAIAQRLVRTLCANCKFQENAPAALIKDLQKFVQSKIPLTYLWSAQGCAACNETGYAGRISINEVLVVNDVIRKAIVEKASAQTIRSLAIEQGMTTMFEDGLEKVSRGITSVEEILRTAYE